MAKIQLNILLRDVSVYNQTIFNLIQIEGLQSEKDGIFNLIQMK